MDFFKLTWKKVFYASIFTFFPLVVTASYGDGEAFSLWLFVLSPFLFFVWYAISCKIVSTATAKEEKVVKEKKVKQVKVPFLKPTPAKIILTMLLLFLWVWYSIIWQFFFGMSLSNICLPYLEGSTPTPTSTSLNIKDTMHDFYTIATGNTLSSCAPQTPSYEFASSLYSLGQLVITIIFSYIISCLLVFCISKLKKKRKRLRK